MGRTWTTHSVEETEQVGAEIARSLTAGTVVALFGDLGMGKTAFVRGMARGRGLEAEVSSPTFALVHDYGGSPPLIHFDMYRVSGWDDLYATGFLDYQEAGVFWWWNGARTSRRLCRRTRCGSIFAGSVIPSGRLGKSKRRQIRRNKE